MYIHIPQSYFIDCYVTDVSQEGSMANPRYQHERLMFYLNPFYALSQHIQKYFMTTIQIIEFPSLCSTVIGAEIIQAEQCPSHLPRNICKAKQCATMTKGQILDTNQIQILDLNQVN